MLELDVDAAVVLVVVKFGITELAVGGEEGMTDVVVVDVGVMQVPDKQVPRTPEVKQL